MESSCSGTSRARSSAQEMITFWLRRLLSCVVGRPRPRVGAFLRPRLAPALALPPEDAKRTLLQVDHDPFRKRVVLEGLEATLAAEAALLVAAQRQARHEVEVAVHPDRAGADLARHAVRAA